eukprot:5474772-Pleurochrysis_carterae.AAC.3
MIRDVPAQTGRPMLRPTRERIGTVRMFPTAHNPPPIRPSIEKTGRSSPAIPARSTPCSSKESGAAKSVRMPTMRTPLEPQPRLPTSTPATPSDAGTVVAIAAAAAFPSRDRGCSDDALVGVVAINVIMIVRTRCVRKAPPRDGCRGRACASAAVASAPLAYSIHLYLRAPLS